MYSPNAPLDVDAGQSIERVEAQRGVLGHDGTVDLSRGGKNLRAGDVEAVALLLGNWGERTVAQ